MKKFISAFLLISGLSSALIAQVPQKLVVEHFTNSRCSICASRNPGFYSNYNNLESATHIAFHPSSPYPQCIFNMYDVAANDARTNYYGVYGSTPQYVVNGVLISPSSSITMSGVFNPFINLESSASIKIEHIVSGQAVQLRVVVYTEAAHTGENLRLFAGLKEDLVNYAAPNGENIHHDVFRKSWFDIAGQPFVMAATTGDSVEFVGNLTLDNGWNPEDFSTIVIIQKESNKEVIQSEESGLNDIPLSTRNQFNNQLKIYPNPANSFVTVSHSNFEGLQSYKLTDVGGRIIISGTFQDKVQLGTGAIPAGVYYLFVGNKNNTSIEKLLIAH
ncbi:MAG: T9SS type A sorting domain-containing protein [Bacteroidia bacterium]